MSETQHTLNRQPWGPWETFGFGVVIVVVFVITELLVGIVFFIIKTASQPGPNPTQVLDIITNSEGLVVALATMSTAIVGVGLIIAFISVRSGISIPQYLGLKPISTKAILISLALVAGLIVANDVTCIIIGRPVNPPVMVDMYNTSVWPALFWIAVVIFAPVFEETFFRGFLFKGFSYSRLGVIGTIVLTSLGWTLLHQQYEVFELVSIFLSGLLLGTMRFKTGSLWAPLIMHSFANIIATLEVALNVNSLFG
ncbi:lysostaphin resistance A-like protein [Chloroflexota bacterium]